MADGGTPATPDGGDEGPGVSCRVCGQEVPRDDGVACVECFAPHHRDCFEYTGVCSTFGCGGLLTTPWEDLPATYRGDPVYIDRSTRPGWLAVERRRQWLRYVRNRAADLPVPVGAGLAGGLMTMAAYLALRPTPFAAFPTFTAQVCANIMLCGVLHGLVAPFVTPAQHHRPVRTAAVAIALLVPIFSLGHWVAEFSVFNPAAVLAVVLGLIASTSASERLVGRHTKRGRGFGRYSGPVRGAVAWLFFAALFIVVDTFQHGTMTFSWLQEIMIVSLLVPFAGIWPLALGRDAYQKRLMAEGEEKLAELRRLEGPDA